MEFVLGWGLLVEIEFVLGWELLIKMEFMLGWGLLVQVLAEVHAPAHSADPRQQ